MLPVANTAELREQLAVLDGWYERLGEAGQDFIKTFRAIGTREVYDPDSIPTAAFHGFGPADFINAVIYGPRAAADDLRNLFSIRTHEAIHALQAHVCAAVHADPINKRSSIILCPRDYIKLELLKERGAFGGQFLFNTLINRLDTGKVEKIGFSFAKLADPENAAAVEQLKNNIRKYVDDLFADPYRELHKLYCAQALDRYELAMATDRKEELTHGELRFVRLEAEDIAAAGEGFVLNTFVDSEGEVLREYLDGVALPPELEARVQVLNRMLGIADESTLPTFGVALAEAGSNREQFLIASITGEQFMPVLNPPQKPPPGPAPL